MDTLKVFAESLMIHIKNADFAALFILIALGIKFILRYIWLILFAPALCGSCGTQMVLYFRRSEFTVTGTGSAEELFDWLVCRECLMALPLE